MIAGRQSERLDSLDDAVVVERSFKTSFYDLSELEQVLDEEGDQARVQEAINIQQEVQADQVQYEPLLAPNQQNSTEDGKGAREDAKKSLNHPRDAQDGVQQARMVDEIAGDPNQELGENDSKEHQEETNDPSRLSRYNQRQNQGAFSLEEQVQARIRIYKKLSLLGAKKARNLIKEKLQPVINPSNKSLLFEVTKNSEYSAEISKYEKLLKKHHKVNSDTSKILSVVKNTLYSLLDAASSFIDLGISQIPYKTDILNICANFGFNNCPTGIQRVSLELLSLLLNLSPESVENGQKSKNLNFLNSEEFLGLVTNSLITNARHKHSKLFYLSVVQFVQSRLPEAIFAKIVCSQNLDSETVLDLLSLHLEVRKGVRGGCIIPFGSEVKIMTKNRVYGEDRFEEVFVYIGCSRYVKGRLLGPSQHNVWGSKLADGWDASETDFSVFGRGYGMVVGKDSGVLKWVKIEHLRLVSGRGGIESLGKEFWGAKFGENSVLNRLQEIASKSHKADSDALSEDNDDLVCAFRALKLLKFVKEAKETQNPKMEKNEILDEIQALLDRVCTGRDISEQTTPLTESQQPKQLLEADEDENRKKHQKLAKNRYQQLRERFFKKKDQKIEHGALERPLNGGSLGDRCQEFRSDFWIEAVPNTLAGEVDPADENSFYPGLSCNLHTAAFQPPRWSETKPKNKTHYPRLIKHLLTELGAQNHDFSSKNAQNSANFEDDENQQNLKIGEFEVDNEDDFDLRGSLATYSTLLPHASENSDQILALLTKIVDHLNSVPKRVESQDPSTLAQLDSLKTLAPQFQALLQRLNISAFFLLGLHENFESFQNAHFELMVTIYYSIEPRFLPDLEDICAGIESDVEKELVEDKIQKLRFYAWRRHMLANWKDYLDEAVLIGLLSHKFSSLEVKIDTFFIFRRYHFLDKFG